MKTALISIFTSILTLLIGVFLVYNYLPLSVLDRLNVHQPQLGSTITTILGTDTLSASRSVINTNFSNLNTDKAETTVTTLANLTTANALTSATSLATLAALSTVGTITTGVWNGTAVTVPFGGTGSTTLSSNQVLLGNGTGIMKVVSGWGTSGQFLTSNGGVLAPSWTSGTIDTSQAFTWTGTNIWTAAASSTRFAALDTIYVGRLSTSTIQGVSNGTSTLQGFLNILGTNSTSTISGGFAVSATTSSNGLVVNNECIGCVLPTIVTSTSGACGTNASDVCTVTATCPAGKKVSGGGYTESINNTNIVAEDNYADTNTSWTIQVQNSGTTGAHTITAYAMCVNP